MAGRVVGSEAFLERVRGQVGLEGGDPEGSGSKERAPGRTTEPIVAELAERLGVDPSAWAPERCRDSGERAVAAHALRRLVGDPRGEVAEALGDRSASRVAYAERRVLASRWLQEWAQELANDLEG